MLNNEESNLGDLLLLLRRNILESMKKAGIKTELTFSQMEILHFVGVSGKKTMKNVADFLKITPPSVSELVKEMEKKNLVRRVSGKKDKRIVSVVLTNNAKKNYISITKSKEKILNQMVSRLSEKDKKTLERIIKIITEKK